LRRSQYLGAKNRATLCMTTKDSALKNGSITIYKPSTTQEESQRTARENKGAGLNELCSIND